jgi:hypothetical protein
MQLFYDMNISEDEVLVVFYMATKLLGAAAKRARIHAPPPVSSRVHVHVHEAGVVVV